MKLLFDHNLSHKLPTQLSDLFPSSDQVRRLGLASADDREIWQVAKSQGFTIVTQDSDFGELAALYGPPPAVVWLRCGNQTTHFVEALLRQAAPKLKDFVESGESACLEIYG